MPTIYDQVRCFIKDEPIIPDSVLLKSDENTQGRNSRITKYTADLFKYGEIPLRAPMDKISSVRAERSLLEFPGGYANGELSVNQVYDYTATISFGYPRKNMYIDGEKAYQIFSIMEREYFMRQQVYYAQKNIQYAVDYYNNLYNIMSKCGCTNKIRYAHAKDIKAIQYNVFRLFAAYIMNCKTHEKIKNGFECGIGQTTFHCTREHTYHTELDPNMNRMFFCWYFKHKKDYGPDYFHTLYDEKRQPYAFSGLGANLLSLYDNVYNGGQEMFPGPLTKRFLATQSKTK